VFASTVVLDNWYSPISKFSGYCLLHRFLALHVVRYNPNLAFQFLSKSIPAVVRAEEEEKASVIPLQKNPANVFRVRSERRQLDVASDTQLVEVQAMCTIL
jgi:hypothetical protein